jgi:Na+-translocating ferredoxin:NAD+ oxidoreductase RnfC subunit
MGMENDEIYNEALICCECGICELYACPMGLSPRKVNIHVKNRLRSKGITPSNFSINMSNSEMRNYRKILSERLISRLNLSKYDRKIADDVIELHPGRVCIPLKQHIGACAVPVVACGEEVDKGQLIAAADYEGTGANIHASIDGKIEYIGSTHTIINSVGLE